MALHLLGGVHSLHQRPNISATTWLGDWMPRKSTVLLCTICQERDWDNTLAKSFVDRKLEMAQKKDTQL